MALESTKNFYLSHSQQFRPPSDHLQVKQSGLVDSSAIFSFCSNIYVGNPRINYKLGLSINLVYFHYKYSRKIQEPLEWLKSNIMKQVSNLCIVQKNFSSLKRRNEKY